MSLLYYAIYFISILNLSSINCDMMISISNITSNNTAETQFTNCRISTDKLVADAQATVTRVLTGGCNAKLIDERFNSLENALTDHFNEIKKLIQQLVNSNNQVDLFYSNKNILNNKIYFQSPRQNEIDDFNDTVTEIPETNGLLKNIILNPFQSEIFFYCTAGIFTAPFVSKIFFYNTEKIFTYYWKVDNIKQKLLSWKTGVYERSNTFYIKDSGFAMFIKFTPKYFPDGTVFISVGLTKGCFDDQLNWPFHHKLQIEVLDHSPESSRHDRKSRSWDPSTICPSYFWERPQLKDNPECVGTSILRYFLTNNYFWNDSLYVKLIVYL